jgi:AhpD family alkylhydroperoxidase
MSTTPRLPSAIADRQADFPGIMAHQPQLGDAFWTLYGEVMARGIVSQKLKETARMRNARVTGCGFCRNVRYAKAQEEGLDENQIAQITDDHQTSGLDERQKLVLQYTDAFLLGPAELTAEVQEAMASNFTNAELVELTMALALYLGMAKPLIAFGTEPESMDTTVLPTPDPDANPLAV